MASIMVLRFNNRGIRFLAVYGLILMLSAFSWADSLPKEVQINLSIEDINDWAVEDDALWLQLTGPAQVRVNTRLTTEPEGTRYIVNVEGLELLVAHWYAEDDINVIRAPVNDAAVKMLQKNHTR
ncbi:hypothetical protein [Saccharospirillum impatiens]|uniref:hypothetical protein n=1 Tax=Saccharospirillum impatiens TaxID=169438 RepID=UPI00041CBEE3|nr:hypothetical protein [Saccharospirillum impatiens]